jgi:hypothetical protein
VKEEVWEWSGWRCSLHCECGALLFVAGPFDTEAEAREELRAAKVLRRNEEVTQ